MKMTEIKDEMEAAVSQAATDTMSQVPTKTDTTPQVPTKTDTTPQVPAKADTAPQVPAKAGDKEDILKKYGVKFSYGEEEPTPTSESDIFVTATFRPNQPDTAAQVGH